VGGDPPDWSTGFNHLPVEQDLTYEMKRVNQRNNIYQATLCSDISDPFVLMNDDFIFLTHAWPLPIIQEGKITEHRKYRDNHPNGYRETGEWLAANGYPTLVYSEHRAMVMWKNIMAEAHLALNHIIDYPVPTAYGNMAGLESVAERGEDAIFRGIWDKAEWQISTFEKDFQTEPYGQLIRYMHADPSPYERT
jgi:hypothetical protein